MTAAAIAVVGNVNLDIKTTPLVASDALFQDGETSVEEIYESIGGGAGHVAMAAAALGAPVHLCASVGDDALGDRLRAYLDRHRVIAHLQSKPVPTGRTLALHWHDHSRHFMSHLPHTRLLAVGDVDVQALSRAGCRHLYRADVWFAPLMLAGGNRTVLEQARTAGMTTLLDINWDPAWSGRSTHQIAERKAQVLDVLPFVTWANGNERELCLFSDERDVRAACGKLLERGAAGVVVHRGKLGAAAVTPDEDWLEVPAERVDDVSCAAGAGDVFSAAFMTMEGLPLRERLTACARLVADHLSGRRSLIPRFD